MRIKKDNGEQAVKLGCLGKIKTGDKNEKGYPVSLDYFRLKSEIASREKWFTEKFGEKPNTLPITFYSNDPNECCSQHFELRDKGGRLVAYGDGYEFFASKPDGWQRILKDSDEKKALLAKLQTDNSIKEKYQARWTEVLILKFLIIGCPEIGYFEYRTLGKETAIPQIISVFDFCQQQFGRVLLMPFTLQVTKHKSNRAEVNRIYSVVQLICLIGIDAVKSVRDWDGIGILSEEKLTNAVNQITAPVIPVVEEKEAERDVWDDFEEVFEEVFEDQNTEAIDLAKDNLIQDVLENIEYCQSEEELNDYYELLCRKNGRTYIESMEGVLKIFNDNKKRLK